MKRRGRTWTMFGAFAVLLISAMGVVTAMLLRFEEREARAQLEADQQERIGLALWRMESAFAPLLARESARPYFHYLSFFPVNQAYNRMLQPVAPGEALVASPLLTTIPEYCALHIQVEADGEVNSPRVPPTNLHALALQNGVLDDSMIEGARKLEEFRRIADRQQLAAAARRATESTLAFRNDNATQDRSGGGGREVARGVRGARDKEADADSDLLGADIAADNALVGPPPTRRESPAAPRAQRAAPAPTVAAQSQQTEIATPQQAAKSEYQQRVAAVDNTRNMYIDEVSKGAQTLDVGCTLISQGVFVPMWLRTGEAEPQLLLVRPVTLELRNVIQCVWLDWPTLRTSLEERVRDLLPTGRLEPLREEFAQDGNALASIPAAIRAGGTPVVAQPMFTPTRLTLLVAWVGLLGGVFAVGFVMHALTELGERRGRFVSAVTHELRTPLTTFCLYTQMLDDDMVPDEAARRDYVSTLRRESERLTRIVENVLWYARLSDLRGNTRVERVAASAALARIIPALERRAADGHMRLVVDVSEAADRIVEIDVQSLERVLVNLVDNACKYVGAADDRRIHLWTKAAHGLLRIFVADYGPGIPQADAQRIFEPFERSAATASWGQSASQGVGLGLALARGLMRELRGDLSLEDHDGYGATFALSIPSRQSA
ncbi:MAG: HAMP domain-containing histidine kinase [Phycisphaerales bacterium]|nr:HAMP domain-containing histidine kinase [Phycisphaerales bacterium]